MKNLIRNKPFKIFKALYANRILIEPKKKVSFKNRNYQINSAKEKIEKKKIDQILFCINCH